MRMMRKKIRCSLYDYGRTDFEVYKKLYGLHPYIVSWTGKLTKLCIQSW
jgi:hypothetical protein